MLHPRESESRELKDLSGLWRFRRDARNEGLEKGWHRRPLPPASTVEMPVPASYNDLPCDDSLRNHVGLAWYEREVFVPAAWRDGRRVVLRFGGV
ncbi:MAG TPA: sugar-binding domain-containing protein, partial [Candidatus Methylacidiphilales bacterium]